MTPFNLLRQRCGLSLREAADFLEVPENTIKKWNRGAYNPPAGVMEELRDLHERIEGVADAMIETYEEAGISPDVPITVSINNHGLPCDGAAEAALGAFIAVIGNPVEIVENHENPAWLVHVTPQGGA